MSIALMTLAWKSDLPAGRKMVLLALCDNANDQGECFPSVPMLAKKCSMGERTVQQHIADMEDSGIVRREMRNGRSTIYHIDPRKFCTPADSAPPQISHPTPAESAPPPPQNLHHTPADFAPITIKEPSIEPSGNHQKAKTQRATRLPADWSLSDADLEFCKTNRPDLIAKEVAEQFRDYWISQPDGKAKKTDWSATWRIWVRNQRQTQPARASPVGYKSPAEKSKEIADALTGRNRNEPRIIDLN